MIPKRHRLTRREVDALFAAPPIAKEGVAVRRVLHTNSFFVVAESSERFKAGVAIPKKVLKSAVRRNALRRSMYDALREIGFLSLPYSILVSVKKGSPSLTRSEVSTELLELYKKLTATPQ